MGRTLTVRDVRNIGYSNYEHGGDYLVEYMTEEDIRNFIAQGGTVKKLFKLMEEIQEQRRFFKEAEAYV